MLLHDIFVTENNSLTGVEFYCMTACKAPICLNNKAASICPAAHFTVAPQGSGRPSQPYGTSEYCIHFLLNFVAIQPPPFRILSSTRYMLFVVFLLIHNHKCAAASDRVAYDHSYVKLKFSITITIILYRQRTMS